MSLCAKMQGFYLTPPEPNVYCWPGQGSSYCFPLNSWFSSSFPRSPTSMHKINSRAELISGNSLMKVRLVEVLF